MLVKKRKNTFVYSELRNEKLLKKKHRKFNEKISTTLKKDEEKLP